MFCTREIISSPPQGNWHIFGPVSWDITPAMLSFSSTSSHTATLCHHLFFAVLFSVLHQVVALTSTWSTPSSTGCPGRLSLLPLKILSCLSTSPPMLLPAVSQQTVGGRSFVFSFVLFLGLEDPMWSSSNFLLTHLCRQRWVNCWWLENSSQSGWLIQMCQDDTIWKKFS